ncbi:hypothetical protein MRX96_053902 [Rhipicephalus microplus]
MLRLADNQVLCPHSETWRVAGTSTPTYWAIAAPRSPVCKAVFRCRVSRDFNTTMISSALILGVSRGRPLIRLPFGCAVRAVVGHGTTGFPGSRLGHHLLLSSLSSQCHELEKAFIFDVGGFMLGGKSLLHINLSPHPGGWVLAALGSGSRRKGVSTEGPAPPEWALTSAKFSSSRRGRKTNQAKTG